MWPERGYLGGSGKPGQPGGWEVYLLAGALLLSQEVFEFGISWNLKEALPEVVAAPGAGGMKGQQTRPQRMEDEWDKVDTLTVLSSIFFWCSLSTRRRQKIIV